MSSNAERVAKSRKKAVQKGALRLYGVISPEAHEAARKMVSMGLASSITDAIERSLKMRASFYDASIL